MFTGVRFCGGRKKGRRGERLIRIVSHSGQPYPIVQKEGCLWSWGWDGSMLYWWELSESQFKQCYLKFGVPINYLENLLQQIPGFHPERCWLRRQAQEICISSRLPDDAEPHFACSPEPDKLALVSGTLSTNQVTKTSGLYLPHLISGANKLIHSGRGNCKYNLF